MHPRITEVLDHLTAGRQALSDAVDTVNTDARETRPAADAWSVAEVLEHLAIVETAVAERLGQRIDEARANGLGVETDTSSVVNPRHVAKVMDRAAKITASETSSPRSSLSASAAWTATEGAHDALRALITRADGLALGEVTSPHRIFGELSVYAWFEFLGSHEMRHAEQIREIGAALRAGS